MERVPRTFVMGDIHGSHKAMLQCFERSSFDREKDTLIFLGDVCDGWPKSAECLEELISLKNLIYVTGNHDVWLLGFLEYEQTPKIWTSQGGMATIASYVSAPLEWRKKHLHYLKNETTLYCIDDQNNIFVHGGFKHKLPMKEQFAYDLYWDRHLIEVARIYEQQGYQFKNFKEIFVGHTTTEYLNTTEPQKFSNLWMLDTGAGWGGKLTIMDTETHEYWQSDLSRDLYPNCKHTRS